MASDIDAAILLANNTNGPTGDVSEAAKTATSDGKTELDDKKSKKNVNSLDYGKMSIEDAFNLAKEFVKAKDGTKALQISYDDRNMMNVLCKQVKHCKFNPDASQVGFLDLVGKDRLQLWKSLGHLTREEAMNRYINLVAKVCPLFPLHFEAHKRHVEEQEELRLKLIEEEEKKKRDMAEQKEKKLREEDLKMLEEGKKRREEIQRKQIQEALNQQTYPHFKAYAEQQHPNNNQAQEDLIKQLQEQHFEQYMNQVYQQQLLHQQQQAEQLRAIKRAQKKQDQSSSLDDQFKKISFNTTNNISINENELNNNALSQSNRSSTHLSTDSVNLTMVTEASSVGKNNRSVVAAAALKTKPNHNSNNTSSSNNTSNNEINLDQSNASDGSLMTNNLKNLSSTNNENATKASLNSSNNNEEDDEDDEEIELPPISAASMLTRKDIKEFKDSVRRDNDAVIKVGSGETVTVRVPTHEDGRLIFWEFATDYYDLGFGLHFEWTISPSNNVTVHVSDSSEDEEGEEEAEDGTVKQDLEKGDKSAENKPPCDEIIPIFRRDCHEEVYAGSHLYPGRGVYLLKFDNSYSLWRSKTLYYRVYYSK